MSYQIPNLVKTLQLQSTIKVPLSCFTPSQDVMLGNVIVTMYIRGLLTANFQMKINCYYDSGSGLQLSSLPVNNLDIPRTGDFYCELRFDFPALKNLLTIGHKYYLEFELYGTYPMDDNNFVGLIIDYDSQLAILNEGVNVIRHSTFYEIV